MDPTNHLYAACASNELPTDAACLRAFFFDRCTDWQSLLGLYKGIPIIERQTFKDHRESIRRAAAAGGVEVLRCIARIYEGPTTTSSGYWRWFQAHRRQLEALATPSQCPSAGSVVRLDGLGAALELNGAIGRVTGPAEEDGRLPVRLRSPAEAVASRPAGVRVRPANLTELPAGAAAAVQLFGTRMYPACTTAFGCRADEDEAGGRGGGGGSSSSGSGGGLLPAGWQRCEVPALLGLPLALLQLAPEASSCSPPGHNESMAVLLLIDTVSGFAPAKVQLQGLGPVLVARTDGRDFTAGEMWQLHDYNHHLMDCWPEFTDARRRRALTPDAFRAFTRSRAS